MVSASVGVDLASVDPIHWSLALEAQDVGGRLEWLCIYRSDNLTGITLEVVSHLP